MRLVALFMVFIIAVGAFGQSCERTIPVALDQPGLEAKDFAATLNKQNLKIVKVEPIQKSRVLILLPVDYLSRVTRNKDYQSIMTRLSEINSIPGNVSVAYGVYDDKMAFSDHFTSDPQELRQSLDSLITRAESGELSENIHGNAPHDRCLGNQVLNFQGNSQPGDVLVEFGFGFLSFCDHGKHKDNSPTNYMLSPQAWEVGSQLWFHHVLESGLREFHINVYCEDNGVTCDGAGNAFNSFGTFTTFLRSSRTSKKDVEDNWHAIKNFFLDSATKGYLVTVEVPPSNNDKDETWYLTLGADARNRLGLRQNAQTLIAYPDLLLCSAYKKGTDKGLLKHAGVERNCIGRASSCIFLN